MTTRLLVICSLGALLTAVAAADWPQWRGPNRDARAVNFTAPKSWPAMLTQKWKVTVGSGVATPALVGDRLYVFTRQNDDEVTLCLEAATGKTLWQDKYPAAVVDGPARNFGGPRSSPAVAAGKVCTLGVGGVLSCLDAATGKVVWRKDFMAWPRFYASSSPIVVDSLCLAQLGGEEAGGIGAFDLATGTEKWKWTEDGAAYASPVLQTVGGVKTMVAETGRSVAGLGVTDGKVLWRVPFQVRYNAATPIVDGSTVIFSGSGRGTSAVKVEKQGDAFTANPLWNNAEIGVQFNTPVLTNGLLFGISDRDNLFCLQGNSGQTVWTTAIRGGRGYGSLVEAGSVLLALTPASELVVFERNGKEFKQLASYKVADTPTYAYPIPTGNRLYIKDQEALTLWTLE